MSLTQRYFFSISYIGTGFRGSQVQPGLPTVEGALQDAIKIVLKSLYKKLVDKEVTELRVVLTSRTDRGVHAIKGGGHVDIPLFGKYFVPPVVLLCQLNKYFSKNKISIRISDCMQVPDSFHAKKSVLEKLYCYRLGIAKENYNSGNIFIPISEINRTHLLKFHNFDLNKAKEAANLLIGEKDFASFCGSPSRNLALASSVCNVVSVEIEESHPLMCDFDFFSQNFNYYAIKCKGNRFLYKMVRRMVGIIMDTGRSRITLDDVRSLIEKPEPSSWKSNFTTYPGHGLYLVNTVYDPVSFIFSEEEKAKKEPFWLRIQEVC